MPITIIILMLVGDDHHHNTLDVEETLCPKKAVLRSI